MRCSPLTFLLVACGSMHGAELVHQWTFDEPGFPGWSHGSLLADGSVAGSPEIVEGITPGTSALRTSTTRFDKVDVAPGDLWTGFSDPTSDFSIGFWVRRLNVDSDADGVFDADGTVSGTLAPGFQFLINATNHPTAPNAFIFAVSDGTTREVDTTSFTIADTDDSWHHFALLCTRDDSTGALSVDVHLDGALADTLNFPNVSNSIQPDKNLELGVLSNATSFGLEGELDDFRIYDGILDATTLGHISSVPPAVRFTSFEVDGSDVSCSWESAEGWIYWIEETTDLADAWDIIDDEEIPGTGATISDSTPRPGPRGFYRLRIR